MSQLTPCPECRRHIRIDETACPFCAAPIEAPATPRRLPRGRLTRAAVFASVLAGAAAAGCGTSQSTPDDPNVEKKQQVLDQDDQKQDDQTHGDQGTNTDQIAVDAGAPVKSIPVPDHHIPKPYGAPPARKRVV